MNWLLQFFKDVFAFLGRAEYFFDVYVLEHILFHLFQFDHRMPSTNFGTDDPLIPWIVDL